MIDPRQHLKFPKDIRRNPAAASRDLDNPNNTRLFVVDEKDGAGAALSEEFQKTIAVSYDGPKRGKIIHGSIP
jgi:hypothetical protein